MSLVSIYTDVAGQVGQNPRIVKIISTANLATVTAAGYLNPAVLEGYTIYSTDEIHMWYDYVGGNNPGSFGVFVPEIVNGVITLSLTANVDYVQGPVVEDNLASFNNTSGQIKDSGIATDDVQLKSEVIAGVSPNLGGGASPIVDVPVPGLTASSVVVASLAATDTVGVYIVTVVVTDDSFEVTLSADPGPTCFINYVAYIAAQ